MDETPVSLQPTPTDTPQVPVRSGKLPWIIIGAVVFITLVSAAVGAFVATRTAQHASVPAIGAITPDTTPTTTQATTTVAADAALVPFIPRFDKLTLEDLPAMRDTRGIYPYGDSYIVASVDSLVEYNPKTRTYVRTNNPDILPCIYSTAKLGDFLYVACNIDKYTQRAIPRTRSTLAKLDLKTGRIVKRYFTDDTLERVNIWLTVLDDTVWGSSWDGIFALDTKTDTFRTFSMADIGYAGCRAGHISMADGNIRVSITEGSDCRGGIAIRIPDGTWVKQSGEDTVVGGVNMVPMIEGKKLPGFSTLSNRVGDKYFLYGDKTVYSLERNAFPARMFTVDATMTSPRFMHVDPGGTYAVVMGLYEDMGSPATFAEAMPMYVINLKTHAVTDIMREYVHPMGEEQKNVWMDAINGLTFRDMDGGVVLQGKTKPVGTVVYDPPAITF